MQALHSPCCPEIPVSGALGNSPGEFTCSRLHPRGMSLQPPDQIHLPAWLPPPASCPPPKAWKEDRNTPTTTTTTTPSPAKGSAYQQHRN